MKKWILFLISCLVFLMAGCSSKDEAAVEAVDEQIPSEIKIGYQVIPNQELLVKALGSLEKKFPNSKISWVQFESSRDVNTAIASGGIDFGLAGSTGAATGIAQGLSYYVYTIHDVIGENEAFIVQKNSGITDMTDLAGKKVAVPFGSTTHFSFLSALDQAGVDPASVTILDMQPNDMFAAWQRGDIDAGFVWQPTLDKIKAEGGKVILTSKELAEKGIVTADVGIVSKKFAEQYPDVVDTYKGLLNEAVLYYRDQPAEAAKLLAEEVGMKPDETLKMMDELIWLDETEQISSTYLGTTEAPGEFAAVLKQTGDFMVGQKVIESAPDLPVYQNALLAE